MHTYATDPLKYAGRRCAQRHHMEFDTRSSRWCTRGQAVDCSTGTAPRGSWPMSRAWYLWCHPIHGVASLGSMTNNATNDETVLSDCSGIWKPGGGCSPAMASWMPALPGLSPWFSSLKYW